MSETTAVVALDGSEAAWATDMIRSRLRDALRAGSPQAVNSELTLVARDGAGAVIGGLVGATSYGWLHVDMLWVDEGHRNQGIGRRLLAEATALAQQRGCHALWLDTSNAQARDFYLRLGYEVFGELANGPDQNPPTHRRWFFRAPLDRTNG